MLLQSLETRELAFLALIIASFSIIVIVIIRKKTAQSKRNALLLVGPPDAGKTAIFSMVVYGQALPSHTSLQVNASSISLLEKQKTIHVVDIPGHPRIRDQFRDHLDEARAIAFVVDASTISRNGPAVAEHLHNVMHALTALPPSRTLPSLIILAHKADLLPSTTTTPYTLAITRVKTVLERELQKRRISQSGGVGIEGLGEEGEQSEMGGLETSGPAGMPFKFDDWEGGEVTFIGSSSKAGTKNGESEKSQDAGLFSLLDWLDENM